MKIRCPHCGRFFSAPDIESVKTYAAQGGMIQTLTQRIIAQPIIHRYETPAPLWRAIAFASLPAFFAPSAVLYWHVDPSLAGGIAVTCLAVGLVIGSTQVEQTEIVDEPAIDDDIEQERDEPPQSARFEEVTHPGKNSVNIHFSIHEPPHDSNPNSQQKLYHADLALAKAAIDIDFPLAPISWSEVQKRRMSIGEKTFYRIQHQWSKEALVIQTASGAVYLNGHGRSVLRQYIGQ